MNFSDPQVNRHAYNVSSVVSGFIITVSSLFVLVYLLVLLAGGAEGYMSISAIALCLWNIPCIHIQIRNSKFVRCVLFMQPGVDYTMDIIASKLGITEKRAFKLMQSITQGKLFKSCRLDKQNRVFRVDSLSSGEASLPRYDSSTGKKAQEATSFKNDEAIAKMTSLHTVICKNCGARKSLKAGEKRECDYCGTFLNL